jgi:hypothetical protein
MPAEVFGQRFYGARDKAAWHGQGFTDNLEHSALEAFELIGAYSVHKLQLQTIVTRQDGSHIEVPAYGLVRSPVKDDPHEAYFGTVSDDYRLVTPEEFCRMWDERTRKSVDTVIALKGGKQFVLTARLGKFAVKDDEIENYLQAYTYMDGSSAAGTLTSSVRMVCANTVAMAISASQDHQRFVHDQWILDRMARWLEDVVQRAEAHLPELQQAYDVLASYKLTRERAESPAEIKSVLHAAYPDVPEYIPDTLMPDEFNEAKTKQRELAVKAIDARRDGALNLFKGEGRGMHNDATWGTMWGLVQSVNELEDWKKGAGGTGLAHSVLFGDRAATKTRAMTRALEIAG